MKLHKITQRNLLSKMNIGTMRKKVSMLISSQESRYLVQLINTTPDVDGQVFTKPLRQREIEEKLDTTHGMRRIEVRSKTATSI